MNTMFRMFFIPCCALLFAGAPLLAEEAGESSFLRMLRPDDEEPDPRDEPDDRAAPESPDLPLCLTFEASVGLPWVEPAGLETDEPAGLVRMERSGTRVPDPPEFRSITRLPSSG